jgi:hypothetical protein
MAKETKISNANARAALDAVVDSLDAGVAGGYIELRSGTKPVDVDTAPADGQLIATFPLSDPAFGAAVDGNPGAIATANPITADLAADNTGIPTWFRAYDSNAVAKIDGTVGEQGAGDFDMVLDNTDINAGQEVRITSWTITHPE